MSSPFIALLRFVGFLLWTLLAVPPYLVLLWRGWRGYSRYARAYFRFCNRILGFTVVVRGAELAKSRPVLFVANHASYLDILILGSVLDACFVAKAEVATWPGFGFLARIARTVFIDRKRGATVRERDQIGGRLAMGDSLILFPEGTSSDGNRVLPFKSAFFAVAQNRTADGAPLPVQPLSVAYTRLDGCVLCRAFRPFYAWYGDMTLAGHLFAALGLGKLTVEVVVHPVVTIDDFADRKGLAHHCHDVVSNGVVAALAGRLDEERVRGRRPPSLSQDAAEPAMTEG